MDPRLFTCYRLLKIDMIATTPATGISMKVCQLCRVIRILRQSGRVTVIMFDIRGSGFMCFG